MSSTTATMLPREELVGRGHNIGLVAESVVDFWESAPPDWPKRKYSSALVCDIDTMLRKYSVYMDKPIRNVLDCGCGTGNPSIGLAKKGYKMFCVDGDPRMVKRFRKNCREEGLEIPVITCDWRDIALDISEKRLFDAAICRGNSLIYSGSWDQPSLIPHISAKAIEITLKSIAALLRPGGLLYVDITSNREYCNDRPKAEFLGIRETDKHYVSIFWYNTYNVQTRTRKVHARRLFEDKQSGQPDYLGIYTFVGYMLYHEDLLQVAKQAGFGLYQKYYNIPSEHLYDVFLFSKQSSREGTNRNVE